MATQKIEEGDYGVEIIQAVANSPPFVPKAQVVEEVKVAPKVVPKAKPAAVVKAPIDDDSYDEEDMYG